MKTTILRAATAAILVASTLAVTIPAANAWGYHGGFGGYHGGYHGHGYGGWHGSYGYRYRPTGYGYRYGY